MTFNISLPEGQGNLRPRITVIGIGGAGGNAINNMINSNLEGVDFLAANTDAQALENSKSERRVQLGLKSTKGLGAGMRPDIGKAAAEEAIKEVESKLSGVNMAFIAAGMGGGTGTGAAPIIAKLARENGILTVGVVTKPFHFEGIQRMKIADQGIDELEQYVDTLLIIPNQNLFRIANEKTTFSDAFKIADDVLYAGVRGVTDLMVMPGLINLDFSDVKTVMSEMGKAMMGTGEAQGENRAVASAEAAMANPLIDDVSLKGARGLIINITGGKDLTLYEVDEAANRIKEEVDVDANIIFGSTCDDRLEGVMRVSLVATGIDKSEKYEHKALASSAVKIDNSVYSKPVSHNVYNISNSTSSINKDTREDFSENLSANVQVEINETEDSHYQPSSVSTVEINHDADIGDYSNNLEQEENSHVNSINAVNETIKEEFVKDEVEEFTKDKSSVTPDVDTNSSVRRISLFDNLEEDKLKKPSLSEKKEPFLEYSENSNDEVEQNTLDHSEVDDIHEDQVSDEENYSQEEELLDIPTFLRRQAN